MFVGPAHPGPSSYRVAFPSADSDLTNAQAAVGNEHATVGAGNGCSAFAGGALVGSVTTDGISRVGARARHCDNRS